MLVALTVCADSEEKPAPPLDEPLIGAVRAGRITRESELIRGDAFYWGQLMAGALLGSIPVALIYSFFVKYYVAGLTAGAVKG